MSFDLVVHLRRFDLIRWTVIAACLLGGGCAFKVATLKYDEGFSSTPMGEGRHSVRYSGKGLESRAELERLLRQGVAGLCGDDGFAISDVEEATETVMHRWKPEYRYLVAVAACSPQP